MKRYNLILIILMVLLAFVFLAMAQDSTQVKSQVQVKYRNQAKMVNKSQIQHGYHFVDENGDGYNDNAPDDDGDGIPNGLDPDYTGPKMRKGHGSRGFVDLNGDGINDNALDSDGDGIPNGQDPDYVRPMDGTGAQRAFGKGVRGNRGTGMDHRTGVCDGTGPKGNTNAGARR